MQRNNNLEDIISLDNAENIQPHSDQNGITDIYTKRIEITNKKIVNSIIDKYTEYTLSEITNKNNPKILCKRKYDQFLILYESLSKSYPYKIIPKIASKSMIEKIYPNKKYLGHRKQKLEYLINYIYNDDILSTSTIFLKFITDDPFDVEFYKRVEDLYIYPAYNQFSTSFENMKVSAYNLYTKILRTKEEEKISIENKDTEEQIFKINKHYDNYYQRLKKIKKYYKSFSNDILNESNIYLNFSDIIFNQPNFYTDNNLYTYFNLSKNISVVYEEVVFKFVDDSYERILKFNILLEGVLDMFQRFKKYIELVDNLNIISKNIKNKENIVDEDIRLLNEYEEAEKDKDNYAKCIYHELDILNKKYSNVFNFIIKDFTLALRIMNTNELKKIKQKDLEEI